MTRPITRPATRPPIVPSRLRRPAQPAPSLRRRIRRAFPLADGVTYVIAAGALAATWMVAELLDSVAAHLAGLR